MKIKQKSEGKKLLLHSILNLSSGLALVFCLVACSSVKTKDRSEFDPKSEENVEKKLDLDEEISLSSDRTHLDEVRKEIPKEIKKDNDELAYTLSLMKEGKRKPNDIRSRYQKALRKKRNSFNKNSKKLRKNFTKQERKKRAVFLKLQKQERDVFKKQKSL